MSKDFLNICYKFINRFIDSYELVNNLNSIDKKNIPEEYALAINNLINEINKINKDNNDSYEIWYSVTDLINNNEYFNKCFNNLTDYELLEFIAQYIDAPMPPKISQKEFDNLVKAGIEKDEREWLWRLAFNYEEKYINFDDIVDYYIKVKDGYYLTELISVLRYSLDIDKIIDKINDQDLINDLKERKDILISCISEDKYNKLIGKLDS